MLSEDLTCALVIVDMQRYYLDPQSHYQQFFTHLQKGSLDYIHERCKTTIPNIRKLITHFRGIHQPIIYLRLCGEKEDRSDLHHFFRESHNQAVLSGYNNLYPLSDDPMAQVIDELKPDTGDIIINKTTFSPFTFTNIETILSARGIKTLVMTGLATSQCVETTARDASERGYTIITVEDCQADYDEMTHRASLFVSRGVCGHEIYSADELLETYI